MNGNWHKEACPKRAEIKITRQDLLYDIANRAYVIADAAGEKAGHAVHLIKDIVEDGNIDVVSSILSLAHAECLEALYPYSQKEVSSAEIGREEREDYNISLLLPDKFSETTLRLVSSLAREYMTCLVLREWLAMIVPELSAIWGERAMTLRDRIRTALVSRRAALRRKIKPF